MLLGEEALIELKGVYTDLWGSSEGGVVDDSGAVDRYVGVILDLCRVSDSNHVDEERNKEEEEEPLTNTNETPSLNLDALDTISNLVALFPDTTLGERILL